MALDKRKAEMRGLSWIGRSQEVAEAAMSRDAPEGRLREDKQGPPQANTPRPGGK